MGQLGQPRQMLTDADAGNVGSDGLKEAANAIRRVRLEVKGFQLRRAAPHEELDAGAGFARLFGAREERRHGQPAECQSADAQKLAATDAVTQRYTGA